MKKMLHLYFTDKRVWLYIVLATLLSVYLIGNGILAKHYPVMFLTLFLAPFYEWLAHKFILHNNIGSIDYVRVNDPQHYVKGQQVDLCEDDIRIAGEVMSIDGNKLKVGRGVAKHWPWLFNFMDELHYGHHRDPDVVHLIFAPWLSVIILYAKMFILALLVSQNLNISLTFLLSVMCYYMYYEWMHLGHHVKGYHHLTAYGRKMKQAHLWHHYKNENHWWGITNPFGDLLFGTFNKLNKVPKSGTTNNINPIK